MQIMIRTVYMCKDDRRALLYNLKFCSLALEHFGRDMLRMLGNGAAPVKCVSKGSTQLHETEHHLLACTLHGYPMQRVATDILGPLPESPGGNSYVLIVADYFTWLVEAFPIPNQEATMVARKLVNEVFCHYTPLEQLHSEQDRQFKSFLLAEVC